MEGLLILFELALTKRHSIYYIPIEAAIEKSIAAAVAKAAIAKPIEVAIEGLLT